MYESNCTSVDESEFLSRFNCSFWMAFWRVFASIHGHSILLPINISSYYICKSIAYELLKKFAKRKPKKKKKTSKLSVVVHWWSDEELLLLLVLFFVYEVKVFCCCCREIIRSCNLADHWNGRSNDFPLNSVCIISLIWFIDLRVWPQKIICTKTDLWFQIVDFLVVLQLPNQ